MVLPLLGFVRLSGSGLSLVGLYSALFGLGFSFITFHSGLVSGLGFDFWLVAKKTCFTCFKVVCSTWFLSGLVASAGFILFGLLNRRSPPTSRWLLSCFHHGRLPLHTFGLAGWFHASTYNTVSCGGLHLSFSPFYSASVLHRPALSTLPFHTLALAGFYTAFILFPTGSKSRFCPVSFRVQLHLAFHVSFGLVGRLRFVSLPALSTYNHTSCIGFCPALSLCHTFIDRLCSLLFLVSHGWVGLISCIHLPLCITFTSLTLHRSTCHAFPSSNKTALSCLRRPFLYRVTLPFRLFHGNISFIFYSLVLRIWTQDSLYY